MSVYETLGPKRDEQLAKGITLDLAYICVREGILNLESESLLEDDEAIIETVLSDGTEVLAKLRKVEGHPNTIRAVIRCEYLNVFGTLEKAGKGLMVKSASAQPTLASVPDTFARAALGVRPIPS